MTDFDVHDHRHELKQLRDAGATSLWENREDVPCPVCDGVFSRLFVSRQRGTTFPENDGARFCLLRDDDAVYLFRH
ncbi:flagella cluster protein [Halorubrum ejinorense]|uniref:Flagella cluster protein n=1 Tax=Halorubrum ejinorense TaxID=425309 RepID=A0AAV3SRM8_9EURY